VAFIGAQRRPLTEEAGGSGAGFSQEGHLRKGGLTVQENNSYRLLFVERRKR
jgi:hypothetical protein